MFVTVSGHRVGVWGWNNVPQDQKKLLIGLLSSFYRGDLDSIVGSYPLVLATLARVVASDEDSEALILLFTEDELRVFLSEYTDEGFEL